jgi:hypothetical protein
MVAIAQTGLLIAGIVIAVALGSWIPFVVGLLTAVALPAVPALGSPLVPVTSEEARSARRTRGLIWLGFVAIVVIAGLTMA